ncbi:magnesium transporter CorA family protein [Clostridium sp. C105KSO13]|uniref:magnesium transporter CorA family protein n=1 Tax=Clostridium sp. C105KSO13 TaxID=1776045 RepID=UPI00159ECCE6|nr:CorA family divalent cation transporter [Clostridium sp. C105KSO13]
MIRYFLKEKLISLPVSAKLPEKCGAITVLTSDEYDQQFRGTEHYRMLKASLSHIHYCKADVMNGLTIGTLSIPPRGKQQKGFSSFVFYMTDSELIFVDEHNFIPPILKQMEDYPLSDARSIAHFFLAFLQYLIKDDVFFLQHFEEMLTHLEEDILKKNDSSFNRRILLIRKELAALGAFYEQLQDMGEDLEEGPLSKTKESAAPLFGLFTAKAERLYSNVQMLKEYSMQLREMHQTQVDMHQNQIMKFLTIVTTIFMPLSLIAGWYGMNFTHMPELDSPYGYIIICVLSLLIVLVEIWLFKIKNWFN